MKKNYSILLFFILFHQFFIAQVPPDTIDDFDTVEINTRLDVPVPGILSNDTDQDNNSLFVVSFSVGANTVSAGQTISFSQGTITINANGSFTFIPATGYVGDVSTITYCISDGVFTSCANIYLTVVPIAGFLDISVLSSCNQGYTESNEYKISYNISLTNRSTARDYHPTSLIRNIDLINDLDAVFGTGCITSIENVSIATSDTNDFEGNPYPSDFGDSAINDNFLNFTSNSIFNNNAMNNFILYPRQSIDIQFCVIVNPFCNGRPEPTRSGSGINFDNIIDVNSSVGSDTANLLLTDFHTSEAVLAAGLFITNDPPANPNGTYDYVNTVIITNEGTSRANNINYNMGLGDFFDNGIVFTELTVSSNSSSIQINTSYDGDTNTQLLAPNNTLEAGETVNIEVITKIIPISSTIRNSFNQLTRSQTQGGLDGFDETTAKERREYSFVTWSDNLGDHLDRYYPLSFLTETASSNSQCICTTLSMSFSFLSSSTNTKTITTIDEAPSGILEHQEITFQLTITNTSEIIQLDNLQLQDNLSTMCGGNIISVSSAPVITNSTATTDPILNTGYNGFTDIDIFDGNSGLLMAGESISVEFTVLFNENCIDLNMSSFLATNPIGDIINSSDMVTVNATTDTDNDGITNINDIDDDNDTILDIDEYNGLDPLDDDDADLIPNYRDTDFGTDANNDGVVDVFDFDNDAIPNHLDLDSDNDGVLDIVETGNTTQDTSNNGMTNNDVGTNGLDDTLENNDTFNALTTYTITNTDGNGNPNFLDIDADDDGIVDNIEAQLTDNYIPPNDAVGALGVDTAYPNGILPIDTEGDGVLDYIDTDSDNDAPDDIIEGWDFNSDGIAETIFSNIDADNDGLDDAYDTDNGLVNPTNNQIPTDFPNVNNAETIERDWREISAIAVFINNVSVTEGEDLVFMVSLGANNNSSVLLQSTSPITIDIFTTNGTDTGTIYDKANAPYDYNQLTTTLTIPPFTETIQFTVTSLDDTIYELDEFFTVNGIITSNNTINTETKGIGSILDNDDPPNIEMNNSIETEGNNLSHTITLSHPSSTPIQINVSTNDETAISPDDYTSISETITIEGTIDSDNASMQASFNILTIIDNINEAEEEVLNVIGSVTTANVGIQDLIKTGTIIDIDPYPILHINNATVLEGNPLMFTITLLNPDSEELTQNYLPIDLDIETIDETASFTEDYQQLLTTISIPAYTSTTTQFVTTIDDKLNESTETMQFRATNLSNGSSITATGSIEDDDFPNLFSPNGDGKSDFFSIVGIESFPNFKLIIVDRWGSEVYNYSNNGNLNPIWWDGTYKGKPVIEGVYFYTLDFNDGSTPPKTNFIQLIR